MTSFSAPSWVKYLGLGLLATAFLLMLNGGNFVTNVDGFLPFVLPGLYLLIISREKTGE